MIYRVSGTHVKRRMTHPREPYFSFLFPSSPSTVTPAFPWPIKGKVGHPTKGHRIIGSPHCIRSRALASNLKHIVEQRLSSQTHSFYPPETWDLSLSRQFVTPYYKLSAGNTSSPKLDIGTFGLNQYNPCVLLAHHLGQTRNTQNTDSWCAR